MDAGELVPDEVTVGMVRHRSAGDGTDGCILDGFPRTPDQDRALDSMLAEMGAKLDPVIEFVVRESVLVQRLLGRGRTDDTEGVIRRRQDV